MGCISGLTRLRYGHSLVFYEELNFNKKGNVSGGTDLYWLWSLEGGTGLRVTGDGIYCNKEARKSATFFVFLLFSWAFEPHPMYKVKKKERQEAFISIDKRQKALKPACDGDLQNKKCFLSVTDCSVSRGRLTVYGKLG